MKSKRSTAFVISRLQLRVVEDDCALSIIRADAASQQEALCLVLTQEIAKVLGNEQNMKF